MYILFKIDGFLDWSDLAFTIHLAQDEKIEKNEGCLPFSLVLVKSSTSIIKALWMVTVTPAFWSMFARITQQQAQERFLTYFLALLPRKARRCLTYSGFCVLTYFALQYEKLKALDDKIKARDRGIANDLSKHFLDVPGVGPLTEVIKPLSRDRICLMGVTILIDTAQ